MILRPNTLGLLAAIAVLSTAHLAQALEVAGSQSGTWSLANSPYLATNWIDVPAGQSLTIEAGVVVKFASGQGIGVNGALMAQGTQEHPIVFTAGTDDVGGDTNGDGTTSAPVPNAWNSIVIEGSSSVLLDFCEVRYAGYSDDAAILIRGTATPTISNCTISATDGDGIRVSGSARPILTGNTITGVVWPVHLYNRDALPVFQNNVFRNVTYQGVRYEDAVVAANQQVTWPDPGVPFSVGWVTVEAGGSLTLPAGLIVKFDGGQGLSVSGALAAKGSAEHPIVFTAGTDDIGGDTNGDGTTSAPVPNAWSSIQVNDGSSVLLDYCEMRYAGYSDDAAILVRGAATPTISNCQISSTDGDGIRVSDSAKPFLTNNTISGAVWPVHLFHRNALPVFQNNTFKNVTYHGVRYEDAVVAANQQVTWPDPGVPYSVGWASVEAGGSLTLPAGLIVKFDQGISVTGGFKAQGTQDHPIVFTAGTDDIGGDTNGDGTTSAPVPNAWYGIQVQDGSTVLLDFCEVRYAGYSEDAAILVRGTAAPTISNCQISATDGDAIRVYDSARPTLDGNTITGAVWPVRLFARNALPTFGRNTFKSVVHHGVRYEDAVVAANQQVTWPDPGLPYSVGWVTVEAGGSLTLPPGLIVKCDQGIGISGGFRAQGTAAQPIVFTAGTDDIGGDTNGDGAASAPAPNAWYGIQMYDGSSTFLDYCQIAYAGYSEDAAILIKGTATPTISNCQISATDGDGIRVHDSARPILTGNTIAGATWPVHLFARGALPVFQGNTFKDVAFHGVRYEDAVVAANQEVTWPDPGVPYSVGWVTVEAGGSLTLPPGLIVKLDQGIGVTGAFKAQGTADQPIVFTALTDDIGGDTNGDGTASAPVLNAWYGIQVYDGSSVLLDRCEVRFAGYGEDAGVLIKGTAAPTISNCRIVSTEGDAVRVYDSAAPIVSPGNVLESNTGFGIQNLGTGAVDARSNWWGDASGPAHPTLNPSGKGQQVSDRVDFQPFLTQVPGTVVAIPAVELSVSQLTFDDTMVGATSQKAFSVANTGTAALEVAKVTVQGADAAQFQAAPGQFAVAPGKSQVVTVTFAPKTAGAKAATVALGHNASAAPATVALQGKAVEAPAVPAVTVSANQLTFGDTKVGATSRKTFTVANPGSAPVNVSRIALQGADAAQFRVTPSNLTLGAKATRTVTVTFAPTTSGTKAATVALTVGTAAPMAVALQGKAVEVPAVTLSATQLTFDDTKVGATSRKTFTVANPGSAPVNVSRIALQGADAAQFKVAPSNLTLGAKATRTVTVTFAPTAAGAKAATVALNVGTAAPATVALQGKAVEAPAIRLSVTSLTFDSTRVGGTAQKTFTVSSLGSSPVTVSRIALQGADAAQFKVAPTNLTLGARATRTVTVTFTPTSAGAKAATVALTTGAGTPATVALQGKAVEAPAIRLSVTNLTFDDTEVGITSQQSFSVSNAGNSPVTISSIALKGDDALEFRVNPSRLTVPARQNRTVTVTFAPASDGPKVANVEVRSGAAAPAIVTLQGIAYEPEPEPEPEQPGSDDELSAVWTQAFETVGEVITQVPAGGTINGANSGKATVKLDVGLSGITYTVTFTNFSNDGLIWMSGAIKIRPTTAAMDAFAYTGTLTLSGQYSGTVEIDLRGGDEGVTGTVTLNGQRISVAKPVAVARTWTELPSASQLQPSYPNPFNSTALIPYYLTAPEPTRLTVYNLLGQEVRVLVDQVEGQGWHQAAWDGRDDQGRAVTTGVYVYQLRLGSAVQQRSLMLLR